MKNNEKAMWVGGGILAAIGGLFIKRKVDSRPRIGDVASLPINKLALPNTPLGTGVIPASLQQFTAVGGNLLVRVTSTVDSNGGVSGIVGAGVPVIFKRADIVAMTRNGVNVPNPQG